MRHVLPLILHFSLYVVCFSFLRLFFLFICYDFLLLLLLLFSFCMKVLKVKLKLKRARNDSNEIVERLLICTKSQNEIVCNSLIVQYTLYSSEQKLKRIKKNASNCKNDPNSMAMFQATALIFAEQFNSFELRMVGFLAEYAKEPSLSYLL